MEVKTNIIGISGKLRNGKDTLTDLIIKVFYEKAYAFSEGLDKKHSKNYFRAKKIAFADPIKQAAMIMFPQLSEEDLWGPSENRNKKLINYRNPQTQNTLIVRDILIQIGAWGRSLSPDCWVYAGIEQGKSLIEHGYDLIVYSDVRFPNEKWHIENYGGKVIRVVRPGIENKSTDISEVALDDYEDKFHMIIKNDGSLDKLKEQAEMIVDTVIFGKTQ